MMSDTKAATNVLQPFDPMMGVVSSNPKVRKTSYMKLLPMELQRRIASFLHPEDAMNLTEAGVASDRMMVRALHPDRQHGRLVFPLLGSDRTGDRPRPSGLRLRLVTDVSKEIVHSMTFHAQWKDQGWGNRKGALFIVAKPRISTEEPDAVPCFSIDIDVDDDRDPFDGGRVVAMTTDMAPHEWSPVELTFTPREGEVYYMWYRVGGGGGHELHLKDLRLQTFVYDDAESSFSSTYQVLYNLGVVSCANLRSVSPPVFPPVHSNADLSQRMILDMKSKYFQAERTQNDVFYPNLLLRLVQSGLRQLATEHEVGHANPDSALAFLVENGLQFNESTLQATEAILQSYIDEIHYDWLVYSVQRQKFRSITPPEASTMNRPYRGNVPRELIQFLAANGNHGPPDGAPIVVQRATINGFRIVVQPADGPLAAAHDGGDEVHVERIPPPEGFEEGNAMPPQVVNNTDGTVSILFGNMGENVAGVAMQEMDMDTAPPVRGPLPPPPPVGMFEIARAAMAAAFGFANNGENNDPPAEGNDGQIVMEEVAEGTITDFAPVAAFFAAMAEEMHAAQGRENDDMDEDAEEVFAQ